MVPTYCFLGVNELLVGLGILAEFLEGQVGVVKIGAHSSKEYVYQFGISAVVFCLFAKGCDAVGLPAAARDGGTLEHVIVGFLFSIACGASGVEA
jgi:hypothetical protein